MNSILHTPSSIAPDLENYCGWFDGYLAGLPGKSMRLLQTALKLAQRHHPTKTKTGSGGPLLSNLMGTAQMVNDIDLLPGTIAATLLAVISGYCPGQQQVVIEQCNATVRELVEGVDEVQKLTHFVRADSLATSEEHA